MKIDNDLIAYEAAHIQRAKPSANAGGATAFSQFLTQAVCEGSDTQASQAVEPSPAVTSAASQPGTPLLDQTGGLLDALDSYGAALADPNLTLKQLEPMANNLEQQAQDLAGSLDEESDEPLNTLAWQAVTQAQAQVLKFRRGDYV